MTKSCLCHTVCLFCPNVSILLFIINCVYSAQMYQFFLCYTVCLLCRFIIVLAFVMCHQVSLLTVYSGQMHKTLLSTLPKNGSNFALCRQTCLLCPSVSRAGPLMRGFVCACSCGCNDQPGHFLDQLQKTCRLPRS